MNYAEAIKRLRNKMLMTQTEFANMLGVDNVNLKMPFLGI